MSLEIFYDNPLIGDDDSKWSEDILCLLKNRIKKI